MEITREDIKRFMEKHNYHTQKIVNIPKEQLKNFTKKRTSLFDSIRYHESETSRWLY